MPRYVLLNAYRSKKNPEHGKGAKRLRRCSKGSVTALAQDFLKRCKNASVSETYIGSPQRLHNILDTHRSVDRDWGRGRGRGSRGRGQPGPGAPSMSPGRPWAGGAGPPPARGIPRADCRPTDSADTSRGPCPVSRPVPLVPRYQLVPSVPSRPVPCRFVF